MSKTATGFLKSIAYHYARCNKKRGDVVNTEDHSIVDQPGFSTEDILWAIGIWSVILTLSPVILFYMLMVA